MRVRHRKKSHSNQNNAIHGRLISHYSFDNFVVGDSNKLAYEAALAVAKNQADDYTPLFICGDEGLGKTHLLHAIGNYIHKEEKNIRICCCTAFDFVNELSEGIRTKKSAEVHSRYHNADILLLDEIQFMAFNEATQNALWQTFIALFQANKRIVIVSNFSPRDLMGFEPKLLSRFEGGLVIKMQIPLETRLAIFKKKVETRKIVISEEIIHFLAATDYANVREMEGILVRLGAYNQLMGIPATIEIARELAGELQRSNQGKQTTCKNCQKSYNSPHSTTKTAAPL